MITLKLTNYNTEDLTLLHYSFDTAIHSLRCPAIDCNTCSAKLVCQDLRNAHTYIVTKLRKKANDPTK